jgi:hypothetical protein
MPRRLNSWVQGLVNANAGHDEFCIPRRGTNRYDEIMGRIRRPDTSASSNAPSNAPRQVRRHRSNSPRHRNGGRIHRSNSPRHPMGPTTIPRARRVSRRMNLPSQPSQKKDLVYDKATGVYQKQEQRGRKPKVKPDYNSKKDLVYDKATGLYVPSGTESSDKVVYEGPMKKPRKPYTRRQVINEPDEMVDEGPLNDNEIQAYVPPDPVHRVIPIDHTAPFMDSQIPNRDQLLQRPIGRVVAEVQDVPVIQQQISGRNVDIPPPVFNFNPLPVSNPLGIDESGRSAYRRALENSATRTISDAIRNRKARQIVTELMNARPIPSQPISDGVSIINDAGPSDVENRLFDSKQKKT